METTKPKPKLKWWHFLLGLFIFSIIIGTCTESNQTPEQKANAEASEKEEANQKARKDTLYMTYFFAKEYIVKNLKDPDSYDEIEKEMNFIDPKSLKKKDKTHIQIKIRYKATNSFNAKIQSTQCFNFDNTLYLIKTFECE